MIEPQNTTETGADSVTASDASLSPKPVPNSAAASDTKLAPQVSVNPDDMHDLFEGSTRLDGADDEDPLAQLRSDPNYAALIKELEYIASEARKLFATEEEAPSDDLWAKIESKLPGKADD